MSKCRITILSENTSADVRLAAEFGLCMLVEQEGHSVLFDTGSGSAFIDNAKVLGIDLSRVGAVALSHNHFDHTRGFLPFASQFKQPFLLYLSKHFFKVSAWDKFDDGEFMLPTSGPLTPAKLSELCIDTRLVYKDVYPIEGTDNMFLLNNIPRTVDFEQIDKTNYILSNNNWVIDSYADEQVLIVNTCTGLVVLTGCAHTGICNICEYACKLFQKPVRAIIGGTHLVAFDEERTARTLDYLKHRDIETIAACHCTGEKAILEFQRAGYSAAQCGYSMEFDI
ncbi:MAG: MBL fold metallo-hydrolase [Oscillospiraceae bacterium]